MSPVDELRTAAVLLRQRAEAATPGPWAHTGHGPGHEHMGCGEVYTLGDGVEGGAIAAPAGDCYPRGGYSPAEDMAWIATVDPAVGLALADWITWTIADFEWPGLVVSGEWLYEEAPDADHGRLREDWTAAWRLARLINGGGS
jgi:hypothetical protein